MSSSDLLVRELLDRFLLLEDALEKADRMKRVFLASAPDVDKFAAIRAYEKAVEKVRPL